MISGQNCLRASLSMAFKAGSDSNYGDFCRPWGTGFNAELEIGWPDRTSVDSARIHFNELIQTLDHRHLGLDAPKLQITTPESMLAFCMRFLSEKGVPPSFVRLLRGHDIRYGLIVQ